MQANDDLWERVARFKEQCDAICAEARQMVLANRALMRIPEHAKRSGRIAQHPDRRRWRSANVAEAFARRSQEWLDLIHTDIDVASTFARMSQQITDPVRKHRLARNAFLAYETALRLKIRIALPVERERELDAKLRQLQATLVALTKNPGDN